MTDVRELRRSDEIMEIDAYLLKHNPVDESDEEVLEHHINWLHEEIKARQRIVKRLGGNPLNKDYMYVKQEYKRLKAVQKKKEKLFRLKVKVMCLEAEEQARQARHALCLD